MLIPSLPSSGRSLRYTQTSDVELLVQVLSLENVPLSAIKQAQSLVNQCQSRQLLTQNSKALAAMCLQVALDVAKYPTSVQEALINRSTIDKKSYLSSLQIVRSLVDSKKHTIRSLCVAYGMTNIERETKTVLAEYIRHNPQAAQKIETEPSVFFVCAQAAGLREINGQLFSDKCGLGRAAFIRTTKFLMTNYSEELAELKKLRADVSGRGSKSASATPKSTSASATPSKLRIETTSFSVVGDDDDEVASLLVVPPPRSKTPQRRSESNSSIKTTPSARTAPNSAKINYVHHRATELDNLLIHGDVAPAAEEKTVSEAGGMTPTAVTPAKKIARGGFRSNAATPASAKNKRRRDLVDEEGDETSTSVATSAVKRNPFIGRQSMINRQDDAGTSKKYLAATKWLEETKLFVLQKLAEKAQIAAAQLTGDSIDGAVE